MNRRDALEILVGSFTLPVLEILPLQFMDRNGKVSHGEFYHKSEPVVPLTTCQWARMAKSLLERNPNFTLDRLHALMEGKFTPTEVNNRLQLTLLPLDLQQEIDDGKMPLVKAIIIAHSRNPKAWWAKAKRLYPAQLDLAIRCELHSERRSILPELGLGTTLGSLPE